VGLGLAAIACAKPPTETPAPPPRPDVGVSVSEATWGEPSALERVLRVPVRVRNDSAQVFELNMISVVPKDGDRELCSAKASIQREIAPGDTLEVVIDVPCPPSEVQGEGLQVTGRAIWSRGEHHGNQAFASALAVR
jgi:hypothetical protein